MLEKEMNSYRFLSGQEPSDEMLNQIMIEVPDDAMARRKKADEAYFSQMERNVAANREKWSARISACLSKN